ncbi:ATPase [Pseudoclavibacter endophyticus]|nr:Clp protease N-terminal domain-containing protein [Pseudoclavibacter endophyticus]GGA56236.1 ATPase [Pseudoclavibacter endophyticus]
MFERFTREAREAVIGAQEVAREAGSHTIDPRHLLVALAERDDTAARALRDSGVDVDGLTMALRSELNTEGLDQKALSSLGIDLAAIRSHADATFGPGALDRAGHASGHIPFTRDAKKSLELALRETLRLKHKTIGGRHLLLGMIRAAGPGRDALSDRGVDLDELRRALDEPDASGSRDA